jgi:hypothetical protein
MLAVGHRSGFSAAFCDNLTLSCVDVSPPGGKYFGYQQRVTQTGDDAQEISIAE